MGLIMKYARRTISKLRLSKDSTIDIRINTVDSDDSFSFDGLSSGQREIISMLFLIWFLTRIRPSVVLINEPELLSNAREHRKFINDLVSLAPLKQYILATH